MAGPTPVSALIHAATMVAAGVYFIARLLPLFEASQAAMVVLAVMAAVTMAGSALAALAQDDIKRVLAYSTIGQLGYMTGALAVADRGAAVFHLLSHGAFKALLFLAGGVIIHAAGTNSLAAMSRMSHLRDRVPDAYWTMTVALLALAAIPPFSGFFSKEAVLGVAEHVVTGHTEHAPAAAGWIVLLAGLLTALLTAAYATRLWLLAFRGHGTEAPDHGRQPLTMTAVLWVLAVPSLALGGFAFRVLPDSFDGHDLTPTLTTSGSARAWPWSAASHRRLLAATTAYAARRLAVAPSPGRRRAGRGGGHRRPRARRPRHRVRARPVGPRAALLGPLHAHAAAGFHLDAGTPPSSSARSGSARAPPGSSTARSVETYVRGAGTLPRWVGAAVRWGPRPAICRPM
ncbi:NADH-quinone oxidoreductase subunit L OS=Streptomyces griseomycini OX=66895 GN=FHS37_001681 PE=4 SV=1 [Streptomyces griseomycini]